MTVCATAHAHWNAASCFWVGCAAQHAAQSNLHVRLTYYLSPPFFHSTPHHLLTTLHVNCMVYICGTMHVVLNCVHVYGNYPSFPSNIAITTVLIVQQISNAQSHAELPTAAQRIIMFRVHACIPFLLSRFPPRPPGPPSSTACNK